MLKTAVKKKLLPSVLDRLIDDQPDISWEAEAKAVDFPAYLELIRQDLEDLLNYRRDIIEEIPEIYPEARQSILAYGLPDLSVFNRQNRFDQNRLTRMIEDNIRLFEPRLKQVRVLVSTADVEEGHRKTMQFTIEGVLMIEPAPERVVFDTQLELDSGTYKVQGAN